VTTMRMNVADEVAVNNAVELSDNFDRREMSSALDGKLAVKRCRDCGRLRVGRKTSSSSSLDKS